MPDPTPLPMIGRPNRPSVADLVYETLRERILSLELQPGSKLSEVEVSTQMDVSRQPVRDAFYRLSKLGLLVIRPQRSTKVSLISETATLQARYIRTALETETVRTATEQLTDRDFDALSNLLTAQKDALQDDDRALFHTLDDQFHREICERSGVAFAWDLIHENKAHMDRVRIATLSFASHQALDDHFAIFEPMKRRDAEAAVAAMRIHLSRIKDLVDRIQDEKHEWFEKSDTK